MFSVEKITDNTRCFVDEQIAESWGSPFIITRGVRYDTRTQPGFAAVINGEVIAYALYCIAGEDCEITVLESLRPNQGAGSALIKAVIEAAQANHCTRVWLITTNDNTHAIRFYQRFGFVLKAVYINSIAEMRKLKPLIPQTGYDDIPMDHEFEFEIRLEKLR